MVPTWSEPTVALEISSATTIVGANLAKIAAEAKPIVAARLDIDFTGGKRVFPSSKRSIDWPVHLIVLNLVCILLVRPIHTQS